MSLTESVSSSLFYPFLELSTVLSLSQASNDSDQQHRYTTSLSKSQSSALSGPAPGGEPGPGQRAEKRAEKRRHHGMNRETSSDIHHSEDSDRNHETNEEVEDDATHSQ